jgi:hypothetical protein
MNPKTGLYERLIDVMLDGRLRELPGSAYEIQREKVDEAEAHAVLSRYLQEVIRNALRSLCPYSMPSTFQLPVLIPVIRCRI